MSGGFLLMQCESRLAVETLRPVTFRMSPSRQHCDDHLHFFSTIHEGLLAAWIRWSWIIFGIGQYRILLYPTFLEATLDNSAVNHEKRTINTEASSQCKRYIKSQTTKILKGRDTWPKGPSSQAGKSVLTFSTVGARFMGILNLKLENASFLTELNLPAC